MRVLFAVSDWASHYRPLVPLGWALQAAGHEVLVACGPGEIGRVTGAGLTALPIAGGRDPIYLNRMRNLEAVHAGTWPHDQLPPHPVTGEPLSNLDEFGDLGEYLMLTKYELSKGILAGLDSLVEFARRWGPAFVVHDLTSLHGIVVAAATDTPALTHLWGPIGTDEPALDLLPEDRMGALARYDITAPIPDLIRYVVDPCPAPIAPPTFGERLRVRYVPYVGAGSMATWLLDEPERPRICVVWGSSVEAIHGADGFILPTVVHGLARLDAEVVVLARPEEGARLGTDLPPNVRVSDPVPLPLVLPGCAAVVHHGGSGCLMPALAEGVPQLSITLEAEQELAGQRLAAAGAGLWLDGAKADEAAVGEQAGRLLTERSLREAAAELRRQNLAAPSPAALVETLATEGLHRLVPTG